ncbi:MAG: hypothetical protein [Bacteriophage sp.]|nr:MAG: hypothetical protein [Bacteriophage sp.]
MMRPKFEVGEVVILQSESRPDCKGEFTVLQINHYPPGEKFFFESGKYFHKDGCHISYFLDDPFESVKVAGIKACWDESALRKKHLPGELSFTDLMASLSSPKLITHQA